MHGDTELWNKKLYNFGFRKNLHKRSVKSHEFIFELYLTKMAYGEEYIQHELRSIEENIPENIAKFRSLAQHELIL